MQKQRLVAKKRLTAGLEMGGLGIQSLEHTVQGFQQNLIQKKYNRGRQADTDSMLPRIPRRINRPSLEDHVEQLGPEQWSLTASRLQHKNKMFSQAFHAVAYLLRMYEMDKESWHFAAILGHTKQSKLFLINTAEAALLRDWDMMVVAQLFNRNDLTGMLERLENDILFYRLQHNPMLKYKLNSLHLKLVQNNFIDKTPVAVTTLALAFRKDHSISQTFN
jgi:hypothetical protein